MDKERTPTVESASYGEIIRPGERPLPENCIKGNCIEPIGYIHSTTEQMRIRLAAMIRSGRSPAHMRPA